MVLSDTVYCAPPPFWQKSSPFRLTSLQPMVFSLNWPHWADSVIESPCSSVCLSVILSFCLSVWLCHLVQFFRPLIGPEITWSVPGLSFEEKNKRKYFFCKTVIIFFQWGKKQSIPPHFLRVVQTVIGAILRRGLHPDLVQIISTNLGVEGLMGR